MIYSLVVSLFLTIIIELGVSLILGIRNKEDIKVVLWVNVLTNPVVVFIANCVKLLNNDFVYNLLVIVMEIIVVIVEGTLYKRYLEYNEKSPLLISGINNVISFGLGIISSNSNF